MSPLVRPAVLALVLALALAPAPAAARTPDEPLIAESSTRHTLNLDGRKLAYTVRVGTIMLPEEGPGEAGFVHTSYTLDGADPSSRPLAFVVNGGPGAASVYLHLGALGPARLVFGPDGATLPPPGRVEVNPATWLAFTDLVFIDPVGTGFSRIAGEAEGRERPDERQWWGVDADLRALGGFVRQYLIRNQRWASPKVLVGESYGGFRMAALAERLPGEFGVAVNGVVLVSPALEFALQGGAEWDVLPWLLRVPTMAAIARAHGKVGEATPPLGEVEARTLGPWLAGLAQGGEAGAAAHASLAAAIGLPAETVARERGRISMGRFAERLLEAEDRRLSVYDGTVTWDRGRGGRDDPLLTQLSAALAGAFADYARTELGVGAAVPYVVLNREAFRRWSWDAEGGGGRARVGAADDLARAVAEAPGLRVLIVHGLHDLVTPYFASTFLVNQLITSPEARARVTLKVYPGGHMFYTRPDSLAAFQADAAALFAEIGPRAPGG